MKLKTMAHSRSGDKGANSNIAVIAKTEKDYAYLKKHLTKDLVAKHFAKLNPKNVICYDVPNLLAFNFILEGVLDGGGSLSLRTDAQGKSLGQAILEMEI